MESDQSSIAVDHISGDQAKSGARYTLTPANHFFGTAQIKITVKDNSGDATSDTTISNFRFIVASVEDAPILAAVPEEARINNEDVPRTFQMQANDNDLGDQLAYSCSIALNDRHLADASFSGQYCTITPRKNFFGSISVVTTVEDDSAEKLRDQKTTALTFNAVNDSPILLPIQEFDKRGLEDNQKLVTLSASDADGDGITYNCSVSITNVFDATASIAGNKCTIQPQENFSGNVEVTVTATDDSADKLSTSETFTMNFASVNDAPSLSLQNITKFQILQAGSEIVIDEDTSLKIRASASDPENDLVDLSCASDQLTIIEPLLTGSECDLTPKADQNGVVKITVTATDRGIPNESNSIAFTVKIEAKPDAPKLMELTSIQTTGDKNTDQKITLQAVDPDGDNLTFSCSIASGSSGSATASISGAVCTIKPIADFVGDVLANFSVSDGTSTSSREGVAINFREENQAPILAPLSAAMKNPITEDSKKVISLSASDADSDDTITYSCSADANALASINDNLCTITPSHNFHGTVSVTVSATDGRDTDAESFDLTVSPVNDAPVIGTTSFNLSTSSTTIQRSLAQVASDFSISDPEGADCKR